jgi:hypothetical protein
MKQFLFTPLVVALVGAAVFAVSQPVLASVAPVWNQGFEDSTDGWLDSSNGWYGTITQVPSGTDGIVASQGDAFAIVQGDQDSGPFSRFDGYRSAWPGEWTAELDVYLDPSWDVGTGFDYSVASTGSDGNHQRDYIFHVTKDTSTGNLFVAASNNTNFAPREDLENINHFVIPQAGWYTLQHVFKDQSGVLAVDLNLLDDNGTVLFTQTLSSPSDTIPAEVGGNRYSWFTFINVDGLPIDEHQLLMDVDDKVDVLQKSGVEGKGLENAPGLQKTFNPKSQAGQHAGKKN